ncbi:hypothetical protein [Flavobacterium sp. JAS]|uniref:hypothetical protein n=1 Tax=Flavobacterium sp. JAS TaxID=2897329 RepID=UPI001E5C6595|nr:hypothetical protein [Flavobacterium sp. JAS]MCD0469110.1 hypothetical protein [Flavobacterium sp. JAS]
MDAIRLEFQPEIKEKILSFLNSFSSDELKITPEDPDFDENKRKVHAAYSKLKNGTTKLYTLEEVDEILEKTISKYED